MHRFFVAPESIDGQTVILPRDQAKHIENVLRLKNGEELIGFDGQGKEYILRLMGKRDGALTAEIISVTEQNTEAAFSITLVQGIAKGDKMDLIIQKAVEIGVKRIIPLMSENTVVRLPGEKAAKKVERWQTIAREACKQCRRNTVPQIDQAAGWDEVLPQTAGHAALMLYENEVHNNLKNVLRSGQDWLPTAQLFLFVGPEGGFAPAEVKAAREAGVITVGLGPRILRTETAGLVAASVILYEMGDLQ